MLSVKSAVAWALRLRTGHSRPSVKRNVVKVDPCNLFIEQSYLNFKLVIY